tara:strand:+ start:45569 stop:46459 length:891 start_codon:yes stop_codon:yes gene_type:complete
MLDWFPNPDHAPLYVAKQQGFFKQHGIDVELIGPADPADAVKLVAAGKIDLALTYQPQLVIAVDQGLPIVRIATLIATPLNMLTVLKDGPIKDLKDLKDKRIGSADGVTKHMLLKALLASAGLTLDDVDVVNLHYDLTQGLLTGNVAAITGVNRNFELTQMRLANKPGKGFYPEDYGVPSYDELVIVVNKQHLDDPQLRPFVEALEEGTLYLINHPQQTWEAFAKQHPELNNKLNRRAWFDTLPRFALRPGALDINRYQRFQDFMNEQGLLKNNPKVKDYAVVLSAKSHSPVDELG